MKPQLALHLHKELEKKKPKVHGQYIISEKLDGIYSYIDRVNGVWEDVHSRQDRKIPAFEMHKDVFARLGNLPSNNIRLIAEAYIPNTDFHTLNGIFNRSIGDYHCSTVVYAVHDIVNLDDLTVPSLDRYNRLLQVDTSATNGMIEVHPIVGITEDRDTWMYHAQQVWEQGGEGVVLKEATGRYQPGKRNSSLMKIKLEEVVVGECTHFYYTVGDKGNRNLNIGVRLASGSRVDVRIPKFSDIAAIEDDSSYILGKNVELKCMCKLLDGSLREPRFNKVLGD